MSQIGNIVSRHVYFHDSCDRNHSFDNLKKRGQCRDTRNKEGRKSNFVIYPNINCSLSFLKCNQSAAMTFKLISQKIILVCSKGRKSAKDKIRGFSWGEE